MVWALWGMIDCVLRQLWITPFCVYSLVNLPIQSHKKSGVKCQMHFFKSLFIQAVDVPYLQIIKSLQTFQIKDIWG